MTTPPVTYVQDRCRFARGRLRFARYAAPEMHQRAQDAIEAKLERNNCGALGACQFVEASAPLADENGANPRLNKFLYHLLHPGLANSIPSVYITESQTGSIV